MHHLPQDIGWIETICGPMFSGKTEELIRRLKRSLYAKQTVQIFKPEVDTRYAELEIVSHSRQKLDAVPVADADEILDRVNPDADVIGVDEAQFFDRKLVRVVQTLAQRKHRVVIAGLDLDYRGVPFEPMPTLMAISEFVTKTLAICVVCGNPAGRSQRLVRDSERVVLGATESYEPRCRLHHQVEEEIPEQFRLF
ncbi:MAG: thymidine kinase [Myxococcota bacterium]